MSDRAQPRERPFHLSPLLLVTLVVAFVSSIALGWAWYADASPPPPPPGAQTGPPPGGPAGNRHLLAILIGFAGVAWTSVVIAAARDSVLRRIDHLGDRWATDSVAIAHDAYQEGYFRGFNDSEGEKGGSGQVVPLRR